MEDQNLKIGMSMLDDLLEQVNTFKYDALAFAAVTGEYAMSPDEHAEITSAAERILKDCDIVEKKIYSDPEALSLLNYVKGRAYAVYLPGKLFPIPRTKSHKNEAISCYQESIRLTSSNKNKGIATYYLARLYGVWGQKTEEISNYEAAVKYLTVNDPLGMEAAKELERLKAKKKGMCFIATAIYGSPLVEEVIVLQKFRDNVLIKSLFGHVFIAGYYFYSPFVVQLIIKLPILKEIIKATIVAPLVRFARYCLRKK